MFSEYLSFCYLYTIIFRHCKDTADLFGVLEAVLSIIMGKTINDDFIKEKSIKSSFIVIG